MGSAELVTSKEGTGEMPLPGNFAPLSSDSALLEFTSNSTNDDSREPARDEPQETHYHNFLGPTASGLGSSKEIIPMSEASHDQDQKKKISQGPSSTFVAYDSGFRPHAAVKFDLQIAQAEKRPDKQRYGMDTGRLESNPHGLTVDDSHSQNSKATEDDVDQGAYEPETKRHTGPGADNAIDLNSASITSALALNPNQSPYKLAKKLFPRQSLLHRIWQRYKLQKHLFRRVEPSADQIRRAYQSGKWSSHDGSTVRPSDLFLKMFSDVLLCLDRDQLAGIVSPPLIATRGVIPLTIMSVITDVMQHYYDCIVTAQHEVLLATCHLQNSESLRTICRALIELSRRIEARQQNRKVVVKQPQRPSRDLGSLIPSDGFLDFDCMAPDFGVPVIYDRENWKHVFKHRLSIKPTSYDWKLVGLPDLKDIPNIELEVILESHFFCACRRLDLDAKTYFFWGAISQNCHRFPLGTFHSKYLIVDRSVVLLNSNNVQDRPNIEMMDNFPPAGRFNWKDPIVDTFYDTFLLSWSNRLNPPLPLLAGAPSSRNDAYQFSSNNAYLRDTDFVKSMKDSQATFHGETESDRNGARFSRTAAGIRALSDALNTNTLCPVDANVPSYHEIGDFQSHLIHKEHGEFPIVMINRPSYGLPSNNDIHVPQNVAWMAGFKYAQKKVFIQTPNLNSSPVVKMCIATARRGVSVILYLGIGYNDDVERLPFQGGTNQAVVIKMYKALKKYNCQQNLLVYWLVLLWIDSMALSLFFLAVFRIFDVIPLNRYTGKDQIRPMNAAFKSRNCHGKESIADLNIDNCTLLTKFPQTGINNTVKFMAIDDSVGIQGNSNHDTQSWFHSQETNVMIDSPKVVQEWVNRLISNQNTKLYGRVDADGIWRDAEGHTVRFYLASRFFLRVLSLKLNPTYLSTHVKSNEARLTIMTISR
ncbi:hypothetical protein PSHT_00967 [Puccinia striiformis]|uniref:PLD phosphodiesterase domain-containing protein n=1 Tax=Puccinia striiformis TaxID=27350 RepID=A0A2S4WLV2_9BASI|nr:hypothetical protein PSHT_00967 [Puccinia striiformis]